MKQWQFQEAKAKLSEVIKEAVKDGPQEITVRGKTTAIIISIDEYNNLINPKNSLIDFLQNSPLYGVELDIKRDKSLSRNLDL
jgi:prevent-host-death family protein